MLIYELFNVVVTIACCVALVYLLLKLYAWKQGNEAIVIQIKRRTPFIVEEMSFNEVVLSCDIPFANQGKQYGTIMDMYPRHLLPQEQFDGVHIESWLTDAYKERHDKYWEAVIIKPRQKGMIRLRIKLTAYTGNVRKDLIGFPDMPIDIVHQVVGRSDYRISKTRIILTAEELEMAIRQ